MRQFEIVKTGIELIAEEKTRLLSVAGRMPTGDRSDELGEIGQAARCYFRCAGPDKIAPMQWPWDDKYWKPGNRRDNLVASGALVRIEIERLQRFEKKINAELDRLQQMPVAADVGEEITMDNVTV